MSADFDLAEFAVVLEPDEPLHFARRTLYACMTALADALSVRRRRKRRWSSNGRTRSASISVWSAVAEWLGRPMPTRTSHRRGWCSA